MISARAKREWISRPESWSGKLGSAVFLCAVCVLRNDLRSGFAAVKIRPDVPGLVHAACMYVQGWPHSRLTLQIFLKKNERIGKHGRKRTPSCAMRLHDQYRSGFGNCGNSTSSPRWWPCHNEQMIRMDGARWGSYDSTPSKGKDGLSYAKSPFPSYRFWKWFSLRQSKKRCGQGI